MNANELAEDLEGAKLVILRLNDMLLQQQAKIEALKAAKIRAYNNGVEDGRKPDTNNEPVAWVNKDDSSLSFKNHGGDWTPLYDHPVKELTIEEIDEVSKEIFKGYKNFYHYQINFARAILRKAQK